MPLALCDRLRRCILLIGCAYAKRTKHPEFKDRSIWEVFQEERASLMALRGPFDGFVEKAVRASTTCLIMADHNRYSVDARAAG